MESPDGTKWPNMRLEFVLIRKLFKDEKTYQRYRLDKAHIKRIDSEFNAYKFTPIIIGKRGNEYAVIDGWHRVQVAIGRGMTHMLALVYTHMDVKKEAMIFTSQSDRESKKLQPLEIHKGKLAEGDELHIMTERILRKNGLFTDVNNRDKDSTQFFAINTARDMVNLAGDKGKLLDETLAFLRKTFGTHKKVFQAEPLCATALLLRYLQAKGFDHELAHKVLKESSIHRIRQDSDEFDVHHRTRKHVAVAMTMVKRLNKGKTGRAALSFKNVHSFARLNWISGAAPGTGDNGKGDGKTSMRGGKRFPKVRGTGSASAATT